MNLFWEGRLAGEENHIKVFQRSIFHSFFQSRKPRSPMMQSTTKITIHVFAALADAPRK